MNPAVARQPLLECGIWSSARPGESQSGDQCAVVRWGLGTLCAVVDGCGHGPEAAAAARAAIEVLRDRPGQDVAELMRCCHRELRQTRGAVVGLASFHGPGSLLTWLGVGNLEARLWRLATPFPDLLLMRGGVAGYHLPPLQPLATSVAPGDLLVLATDGIRRGFAESIDASGRAQAIAARIGEQFATGSDDGLVLVARYLGWTQ